MKLSQTYEGGLIPTASIGSAPQKPKSALRGLMHAIPVVLFAWRLTLKTEGDTHVLVTRSFASRARPASRKMRFT